MRFRKAIFPADPLTGTFQRGVHGSMKIYNPVILKRTNTAVYQRYVGDTISRLFWLALVVACGETVLLLLDVLSGFFADNPLNRINLAA